jgi:hypothetical protein
MPAEWLDLLTVARVQCKRVDLNSSIEQTVCVTIQLMDSTRSVTSSFSVFTPSIIITTFTLRSSLTCNKCSGLIEDKSLTETDRLCILGPSLLSVEAVVVQMSDKNQFL